MTRPTIAVVFTIGILSLSHRDAIGQDHPAAAATFARLLVPETTDQAAAQLLKRAKVDPGTRKYLAEHLPAVIEKGPWELGKRWFNAVRLAGELRIAEAISALTKWIGFGGGGTITMTIWFRLDHYPAGKAMSQIGDPAVPALAGVLQRGTSEERSVAVRALNLIASQVAKKALEAQLTQEQDAEMKAFIKNILDHWSPAS